MPQPPGAWPGESMPAGWYRDPATPGLQRWWDGGRWGDAVRPGWTDEPASTGVRSTRGRRWPVWLGCSIAAFLLAVGLLVYGGVALDHTTGHFGRINVPGESYGLPDAGTYVITDGNYAAAMHDVPDFVVTGPSGESVPVELVSSHRYGSEDNALALFHVPHAGRYRLQVKVGGKDVDRLPSTVTVDRSWDGTGDPLTSAWVSVIVGLVLLLVAFGFGVAFLVAVVRRSHSR